MRERMVPSVALMSDLESGEKSYFSRSNLPTSPNRVPPAVLLSTRIYESGWLSNMPEERYSPMVAFTFSMRSSLSGSSR